MKKIPKLSKHTCEKELETRRFERNRDCVGGYTSYKDKDNNKVNLYVGFGVFPHPVYVIDPKREMQEIVNGGRRVLGQGQLLAKMTDNLTSIQELLHIATIARQLNTI